MIAYIVAATVAADWDQGFRVGSVVGHLAQGEVHALSIYQLNINMHRYLAAAVVLPPYRDGWSD